MVLSDRQQAALLGIVEALKAGDDRDLKPFTWRFPTDEFACCTTAFLKPGGKTTRALPNHKKTITHRCHKAGVPHLEVIARFLIRLVNGGTPAEAALRRVASNAGLQDKHRAALRYDMLGDVDLALISDDDLALLLSLTLERQNTGLIMHHGIFLHTKRDDMLRLAALSPEFVARNAPLYAVDRYFNATEGDIRFFEQLPDLNRDLSRFYRELVETYLKARNQSHPCPTGDASTSMDDMSADVL